MGEGVDNTRNSGFSWIQPRLCLQHYAMTAFQNRIAGTQQQTEPQVQKAGNAAHYYRKISEERQFPL